MDGLRSAVLLLILAVWATRAEEVCQLPAETGPCRGHVPRYFYNSATETCEQFIYGGCGGNGNRFQTKMKCQATCGKEVCQLPPEPGMCLAYIPSYFYNSESGTCEQFVYGGCGGNGNRFETEEKCLAKCSRKDVDVCQLPAETGLCRAYIPSYYYNSTTGTCEQFIYGGCGGNGNRFKTKTKCQATCGKEEDVCQQAAETGRCRASIPKYFYNSTSGACEEFIYGGCGGNGNKFDTVEECQAACA